MTIRQLCSTTLLAVSALLAACGGGADSTQAGINGGGLNGGGSSGAGVAVGSITGFGSIFVNGIEFDLNGASVSVDGVSATQSELRIGQVVTIKGTINKSTGKGTATTVDYRNNLRGVVSSVDAVANTFVVAGQTVTVTGATVFKNLAGLSALTNTTGVEVSGLVNALGKIEATLVEATAITTGNWELQGKITSSPFNQRFNIDSTVVDYSTAGSGQVIGTPALDLCVAVKGTYNNGVLFATRVEVQSCGLSVTVSNNDIGEIEGFITSDVANGQFALGAMTVGVNGSTQYVNGSAAGLVTGAQIEVEGTFNGAGVLVASKCEFKLGTAIRMIGLVKSVDVAGKTLTLFDVPVATNANTIFVDKITSNPSFALNNIVANDFVEVRGYENPNHTAMTAVTLERRNAGGSDYELRATASSVGLTSLTLFGSVVVLPPGGAVPAGIANGDLVRVRGPFNSAWSAPPNFMANSVQEESTP